MRFGGVLAEFAGGIDFGAKHVTVADTQYVAVAQPDTKQYLFVFGTVAVVFFGAALHGNRAFNGFIDAAEDDQ